MGRAAKEIKAPPADTALEKLLLRLRNDERQAIEIVKYLEGDSFCKSKHSLGYCKSYVIELIQTYCETIESKSKNDTYAVIGTASDKSELLLAACGLLAGFEFKPREQGQRIANYCKFVRANNGYNKLVMGDWVETSAATKIREVLAKITKEIAIKAESIKAENGGSLDFFTEVPDSLSLPSPRLGSGLQLYHGESNGMMKPEDKNGTGKNTPPNESDSQQSGRECGDTPQRKENSIKNIFNFITINIRGNVKNNVQCVTLSILIAVVICGTVFMPKSFFAGHKSSVPVDTIDYLEYQGTTTQDGNDASPPVESIDLGMPYIPLKPGGMLQLYPTITPDEAEDTPLSYDSSDPRIVVVSNSGQVIARMIEGKAEITASPLEKNPNNVYEEVPVIVQYENDEDSSEEIPDARG